MWKALVTYGEKHTSEWAGDSEIDDVSQQRWPTANTHYMQKEEMVVAIQLKGKTRGTITVPASVMGDHQMIEKLARESEVGKKWLKDKNVTKVVVPSSCKIINFVF